MERKTAISLEVSSNERECITEDKTIQTSLISKQTESILLHQSTADISKLDASSNMNLFSDTNKINMCDHEYSIENANVIHTYENSSKTGLSNPTDTMSINPQTVEQYVRMDNYISILSDEISEAALSKPTTTESINPQTMEEGPSYVCMDNYINILSHEISEIGLSKPTTTESINLQTMEEGPSYVRMDNYINILSDEISEAALSKPTTTESINLQTVEEGPSYVRMDNNISILSNEELSEVGISNKTEAISVGISEHHVSGNKNTFSDMNGIVNLPSIYDVVSVSHNNAKIDIYENIDITPISSNFELYKIPPCKVTNSKKNIKKVKPRILTNKCNLALALLVGLVITVLVVSPIVWGFNSSDKENENEKTGINLTSTSPANQKRRESIVFSGLTVSATSVVSYSAGTTLIFNGTSEEHDDFDPSTGLFTCPITGIYYISVTLRKNNLNDIYVDVFKMDTRIIHFSENHTGSPWNTVSNSALVSCQIGEIIQMKGWSSGSIYGEASVTWSSFSVIKVYQIDQNSTDQTFVGYSGYANSQSLSDGDPLKFPNQLCDVGNQFSSSRFTCLHTGYYFISATYWKYPSSEISYRMSARVYSGDTLVFTSYDNDNFYSYVTNNALVKCNAGEYIESRSYRSSYLYGSGSYPESIFTVMSLHQEDESWPFIGFCRWKTDYQSVEPGDVITFPGIIMDEGNYFKSNQFICPVEGSYYFLLNLKKFMLKNVEVDLKHGDQTVFRLEDTQRSHKYNWISSSVVIRCLKDEVVKVVAAGPGVVYGYEGSGSTTFTGFLLYNKKLHNTHN